MGSDAIIRACRFEQVCGNIVERIEISRRYSWGNARATRRESILIGGLRVMQAGLRSFVSIPYCIGRMQTCGNSSKDSISSTAHCMTTGTNIVSLSSFVACTY